ncbi:probable cytochrome P450 49a1 isoform X2 [Bacillus rossius redtenbacheri]|uniref:probable cytochrome P450 49a1 isoform X2 n=1 Tax=Bacillus rossius redtenbacheri TaxID=93214 RepID=UPI002FDD1DAD
MAASRCGAVTEAAQQVMWTASRAPRPFSEVPGPRELPLLGNAWRFLPLVGEHSTERLDAAMRALHLRHGRLAKLSGLVGHPDLLFLSDAAEVERVFRREDSLPHRPSMPTLHYYKQRLRRNFFGDTPGVIGVHGRKWDEFRSAVQQVMLQPTAARKYVAPLDQVAQDFMLRVHEMRDDKKELPGNFLFELYKWALESVGRVSLDARLGCLSRDLPPDHDAHGIIAAIHTFFSTVAEVELRLPVWRLFATPAFRDYIGALDHFRLLCMKHIGAATARLAAGGGDSEESILQQVLARCGDPKMAAVLAMDLFLVGVDTTSVAVTSTMYQLSRNPRQQERLHRELRAVLPSADTSLDWDSLQAVPFLRACLKETLRMYPVIIGNGRSLQSDMTIGGYTIPKGTHVIFSHLVMGNSERYFTRPGEFMPERWLKAAEVGCPWGDSRAHPFASLPFGFGRRMCLGRRFAEAELLILLAKMFRKYRVEYHYEDFRYKVCSSYIPENPLKFRLTERAD